MAFDPDAYLNEGKTGAGFDPDAYLGIEKKKPSLLEQFGPQALGAIKSVANDPLTQMGLQVASGDVGGTMLAAKRIAQDPAETLRSPSIQAGLPIAGGALAGPAGAVGGEVLRQVAGDVLAPETVPKTMLGRAGSVLGAGILQDPMAIPGVPKVSQMIGKLASKAGTGAARFGEAVTGVKARDLEQAAKQGLSTYLAPSMEKAQDIFDRALKAEGIASKRPLEQIIDPQLATARDVALDTSKKFEGFMAGNGTPPTPQELLRGRQAVDRIYNATSPLDRATRGDLADLRRGFDDMLSTVSEKVGSASKTYRQAVVKSNVLNPFKITKQGQVSAVAPMVASLAAAAGLGSGHKQGTGLGALGYLAASSPAVIGALATGGGSMGQAFGALAARPEIRQALLQVLQRIQQPSAGQASQ